MLAKCQWCYCLWLVMTSISGSYLGWSFLAWCFVGLTRPDTQGTMTSGKGSSVPCWTKPLLGAMIFFLPMATVPLQPHAVWEFWCCEWSEQIEIEAVGRNEDVDLRERRNNPPTSGTTTTRQRLLRCRQPSSSKHGLSILRVILYEWYDRCYIGIQLWITHFAE